MDSPGAALDVRPNVQELVERGKRSEAASYLLDIVMENGARGGRAMWAALRKVKSSRTELRSILREIQEQGPNLPLLATWNHLEFELPDYLTVIQAAQQRHKEKMREEMERAGTLVPGDYPDLVAISVVREDSLAAYEQLASLVGNNLRDEGVRILCMVLRDADCKVIELELARNGLTWVCVADLISALVSNPSINGLSLNKNNLGDIGVQQLAEGLQHPDCNVEIIQLDSNGLTEASAQGLSDMLQAHPDLHWLILDKNQLGDPGIRKLAEGIRNCRIRRLG
ncbi:NACHT, LRR and PYD domains-containing protein 14-like [Carcharodon carcharias]|uniref:NACHT, LRR and PYD domains-containing protein 14-like n=1 Tax=Carcharodon carcharias TaxID=13397 RepID=UPI001B7E2471|nr:NACHT, LRR and PYD domains-containing protein 14-like [Carcharodon carcharias]